MSYAGEPRGVRWPLLLLLLLGGLLLSPLFLLAVSSNQCNSNPTSTTTTTPPPGRLTAGQIVSWFERQGDSANAAAGIVGNLQQESHLNPNETGGGLAQWNAARYAQMAAYASSRGLSPSSDQGQLAYIQYDLAGAYKSLLEKMDTAPDPATAATMFETGYEQCLGAEGWMVVVYVPGGCMDSNRRLYAVQALAQAGGSSSATSVPVSLAVIGGEGGAQAAGFASGKDPIPSPPWIQERDDMGVDARAPLGTPIYAPAASTLVQVIDGWFDGEPLLLLHFDQQQAGTEDGDQFWYVAEQITPVTDTIGTDFQAGAVVARYAPCCTGIEIGWGSPTSAQRTLAGQQGDPAAANPIPGSTTPWGESFKRWADFPRSWIGTSP